MHALASKRLSPILTLIVAALVIAGCGKGDGPQSISNEPAATLPPIPPGFCDAINFETLCEQPGIENFNGGATIVIDNPDISPGNGSEKVAQMQKFADEVFGGTKLNLSEAIDFSQGEFYKVNVWSPRPVPVAFKLEETGNPGGGLTVEVDHPGGSTWQQLCFDFRGQAVPPPVVALTIIFDLGVLGQAAADPDNWTFFYDDIEQVSSCEGVGGGVEIDPDAALYLTSGDPDLVIPDDYSELTAFGSGSVIDEFYAVDGTYSPVLAVASGAGYGANIAQIGYIGFVAGFAGAYETLDFKVKGMPNQVLFVKLFDGVDALRLNLTSSAYSDALGDGWFQVSIPLERFAGVDSATGIVFESDNTAAMQFTMLLTDIGFSGAGDNPPVDPPGSGLMPEFVVYATDPAVTEDLAPPGGIQNFGSGAVFDDAFAGDADFNPALQTTSGEGYAAGAHTGFAAFTGYAAGFAANYETLLFKVKGDAANLGQFEVKFFAPDDSQVYDLTTYDGSTELGNGWYQVSIPMSDFNAANLGGYDGFLMGPLGAQAAPFSFLMTDIGFSGGGGGGDPGITPEAVVYATDAGVTEDLAPPGGIQKFGSGAVFGPAFAGDADFNPALQTTSGEGYGAGLHTGFAAFTGYAAGFVANYETLLFKVKGDAANLGQFEAKFFAPDDSKVYDLTTYGGSTDLGNGWYQVSIPMFDFNAANLATADGFLLGPLGAQAAPFSFLMTDIGFSGDTSGGGNGECVRPAVAAGADLATNGNFETGDFTCWQEFPNGGTISLSDPLNGSLFAGKLDASGQPVGVTLKQANLGAGELAAGQTVQVTFDWKGTAAAGGVVDIRLLSELAAGGVSKEDIIQGGGVFPADWTTVGPLDLVLGPDVSGGITLQFTAICGGDAGCVSVLEIDNVSIVTP